MKELRLIRPAGLLLAMAGFAACASAPKTAPDPVVVAEPTVSDPLPAVRTPTTTAEAIAEARADSARIPYTAGDVKFMTEMIGHHAQAIQMSRMAPSHGASPAVQTLSARIINAQMDEIFNMQQWLADRQKPFPHVDVTGAIHGAGGHGAHHAMAAGMLTESQMRELDAARGTAFDRLFLTFMIQHHKGAVAMVKELLSGGGAAHNDTVFRLAGDINVDQTTEIARMEKMLAELR